jgi:hypothetical protein
MTLHGTVRSRNIAAASQVCHEPTETFGGSIRRIAKLLVRAGLAIWTFGLVAAVFGVWVTLPPAAVEFLVLALCLTAGGVLVGAGVAVGRATEHERERLETSGTANGGVMGHPATARKLARELARGAIAPVPAPEAIVQPVTPRRAT